MGNSKISNFKDQKSLKEMNSLKEVDIEVSIKQTEYIKSLSKFLQKDQSMKEEFYEIVEMIANLTREKSYINKCFSWDNILGEDEENYVIADSEGDFQNYFNKVNELLNLYQNENEFFGESYKCGQLLIGYRNFLRFFLTLKTTFEKQFKYTIEFRHLEFLDFVKKGKDFANEQLDSIRIFIQKSFQSIKTETLVKTIKDQINESEKEMFKVIGVPEDFKYQFNNLLIYCDIFCFFENKFYVEGVEKICLLFNSNTDDGSKIKKPTPGNEKIFYEQMKPDILIIIKNLIEILLHLEEKKFVEFLGIEINNEMNPFNGEKKLIEKLLFFNKVRNLEEFKKIQEDLQKNNWKDVLFLLQEIMESSKKNNNDLMEKLSLLITDRNTEIIFGFISFCTSDS